MRRTILLDDWLFHLGDEKWEEVKVPHDWCISRPVFENNTKVQLSLNQLAEDPKDTYASAQGFYDRWGIGWYKKELEFEVGCEEEAWLDFDGVYHESSVFINGEHIGGTRYGYSSFSCPVIPGTLTVRVDDSPEHGADRWYSGCGIYRPVTLTVCSRLHIARRGIIIFSENIADDRAAVKIGVTIENDFDFKTDAGILIEVFDPQGNTCARRSADIHLEANIGRSVEFFIEINDPRLWDINSPNLYVCRAAIMHNGKIADSADERFGIRKIEFIARKGLFLNGESIKIKGVNLHHDLGAFGAAWNKAITKDRLEVLRSIGCNAVRTSHNPPASEFLDLCDELGFLVMDESFDKWDTLRYGKIFDECWKQDIRSMIERDRNHPCVIIWSVGNEVHHQGHVDMLERLRDLTEYARELDPSRPVTFAMEPHCFDPQQALLSPKEKAVITEKMHRYTNIIACNYHEQWYDEYHEMMPDSLILGTETYVFFRGYGNTNEGYFPQNSWLDCKKDHVIGQFIWAGIDYLGEAVGCGGWPVRGFSACPVDTAGQLKPKAHLVRSMWQDEPMVYMAICDDTLKNPMESLFWSSPKWASGWNFSHLQSTTVRMNIFTNCEEVQVYLNGNSIIRRSMKDFTAGYMELFVPWEPGEIEAVGYIEGKEVCRQKYTTAKKASKIELDAKILPEENRNIIKVTAKAVDDSGTHFFGCDGIVRFSCSEGAKIVAVDNGDLTDHTPYTETARKLYNGICTCFVRVVAKPNKYTIRAVSDDGLSGEKEFNIN